MRGVGQIAAQVGFATATSLRQHLHTQIGVAALAYRRTFQLADQLSQGGVTLSRCEPLRCGIHGRMADGNPGQGAV
jgi:hypothetical protein